MSKLAILFPGMGYSCDRPLLYYAGKLAMEAGYDNIIRLKYNAASANIMNDDEKKKKVFKELYEDAIEQLSEIDFSAYDDIVFISKSIGTVIAAYYAKENKVACRNIFMTPVKETFIHNPHNGLVISGTKDPWIDYSLVIEGCKEHNLMLMSIDGGNHSLEVDDTVTNLSYISAVMTKIKSFLNKRG